MQLKWFSLIISTASAVLFFSPAASALSLNPMEEPVTGLVQPPNANPSIFPMRYDYVGGALIATVVTQTPLLCADTSAPLVAGYTLNPVYYSPTGIVGATPLPFVFGATAAAPTASAMAAGATAVSPTTSGMQFQGDAVGSLVCYGLNANGTRRLTRDIFEDGAEGVTYNSSVVLSVLHVPTSPSDYYEYTIDVTLPPLPANTTCGANGLDCNFVLLEGFDSSLLATSAANATSGIGGQWCMAPAGTNSCAFPPPSGGTSGVGGNINVNYTNYGVGGLPTLTAPVAPAAAKTYHFVAFRYLRTGVNSLPSNVPVAIAALLSPNDLEENKLDDNVSAGSNQIANAAPAVVSDATWTTFSGKLGALAENTDSGTLTFNITDQDTPDSGGQLHAAVTLNLAGLSVPVTPTCTVISGTGAANRQCSMDINFADPNWWNASVDASYDGQGNLFATDPGGVGASASIVAIDALGKSSAPLPVPIHVQSKVNSAPLVSISAVLPPVADSFQGNALIPTYSCSTSANSCGSRGYVDFPSAVSAVPGPAAAFDELATQTTAVSPYAGADANGGNVQCVAESGAIFLTNGNPLVLATATVNTYELNFFLKNPATVGSSLCTVTITDHMAAFPAGESAKLTAKQFRVVVNS